MSATEPLFIALTQKLLDKSECAKATLKDPVEAEAVADHFLQLIPDVADIRAQCSKAANADGDILKILRDGTQVPASDPRTDHSAVLFPDGTMVYVHSLGQGPDSDADEDDEDEPFDSQHDALAYIEKANSLKLLLGHDDWHLASLQELERYVLDRKHHSPAVDKKLFPGVLPRWHWSSTETAWSSASAWFVLFNYGLVSGHRRGSYGFALAVRRAGQ